MGVERVEAVQFGADRADFGLVFARSDPSKGRRGISAFLVDTDTPGFEVRRVVHTLRSANYGTELSFDDVRVPAGNLLGEEGGGFSLANAALTRQRFRIRRRAWGSRWRRRRWRSRTASSGKRLVRRCRRGRRSSGWWWTNEIDIRTSRFMYLAAAEKAELGRAVPV